MAKPFSNISLVERLAASSYNSIPKTQNKVEQGSVTIVFPKKVEQGESPILRRLLSNAIATSNVLVDRPYTQTFVSRVAVPLTKPAFRNIISLENRLEQSKLGTTKHLPQFFLSDIFTDYIKIEPFGQQQHISTVDIFPFTFTPVRDGVSPIAPTLQINAGLGLINTSNGNVTSPVNLGFPILDMLSRQGGVLVNGVYTNSFIILDQPVENIILRQGVVQIQNQYLSLIEVETPLQNVLELQGAFLVGGVYQSSTQPQTPIAPESIEHGGVEPLPPISIQSVALLQGLAQVGISVANINPPPQYRDPIQFHGSATLTTTSFQQDTQDQIEQGGETPQPFTYRPEIEAPILQTLGYSADRLLAITAPRIKHGSASLVPPRFGNTSDNNVIFLKSDYPGKPGTRQLVSDEQSWLTLPRWIYDENGDLTTSPDDFRVVQPSEQPDFLEIGNLSVGSKVVGAWRNQSAGSTLQSYRALSYSEITERGAPGAPRPTVSPVITNGSTAFRGITDVDNDTDFVDLIIGDMRFRAYITAFSDNYSVNWNDVNYVGRPDTLKAYKGTVRSISLSFKTAAFTKNDLEMMYQKLQQMIRSTAMGTPTASYLKGPVTRLTIGKWVINTLCVVNTIKFDTNPAEYSWDVGDPRQRDGSTLPSAEGLDETQANSKQMPMIVDVSIDFSILGDNAGNPISNTGNFISLVG